MSKHAITRTPGSVRRSIVGVVVAATATVGFYEALLFADHHHVNTEVVLTASHKPVSHEACWVETHEGGPEVVCNTSDTWASWTAECIEAALADHIEDEAPKMNHNQLAAGCMAEADKHAGDKAAGKSKHA
jgi:hypothetical protein